MNGDIRGRKRGQNRGHFGTQTGTRGQTPYRGLSLSPMSPIGFRGFGLQTRPSSQTPAPQVGSLCFRLRDRRQIVSCLRREFGCIFPPCISPGNVRVTRAVKIAMTARITRPCSICTVALARLDARKLRP